jgi:hypothetical protein
MKHLLHSVLLFCLIGFFSCNHTVSAQSLFTVGLEGGPSYTYVHGNPVNTDNIEPIPGGYCGGTFQYFLLNHLAFKSGLAYERKGMELLIKNPNGLDYTFHFDYLTIPFLITASIGKKVRFIASAGLYISYLIKKNYINNNLVHDNILTI